MKRLFSVLLSALLLGVVLTAAAAPSDHLLPRPRQVALTRKFVAADRVALQVPDTCRRIWTERLSEVGIAVDPAAQLTLRCQLCDSVAGAPRTNGEAYALEIAPHTITASATTSLGLYRALQTLCQLADSTARGVRLPQGRIVDWPAFPYRGVMQDVGRTYISMEELRREIDLLARFKINVFHWHLTENQSWRLESKIFPMLNDSINTTRMPGRYYTLDQARELIAYARERGVEVIPELDIPGHSEAFRRTFRHDMQSPEGEKILKLLLEEACEALPVDRIHLGTDEVAFTDPTFVPRMVAFVRGLGKRVISWNPGWHYRAGEVDMTQLWSYRGRPTDEIPAVDSRFHYLNHFDVFSDLVALYRSNVYGRTESDGQVVGAEIALWNDRYIPDEEQNIAQNNLYAAALALAERTWCGGGDGYFDEIGVNLPPVGSPAFAAYADFERRLLWHKSRTLAGCPVPYVRQTHIRWHVTDPFPNGGDLGRTFPPETEGPRERYTWEGRTYGIHTVAGAAVYLRHVWGKLVPALYADPAPNHTAYAWTWVYSPCNQTVGLQAEFQNYSRSEPDLAPAAGCWDTKGSRLWINGDEVLPSVWSSVHRTKSNETPLGNENFAARKPLPVTLRKGWNRVFLKLPVGEFSTPDVRLVKWMFTVVFTTPDGRDAADLVYSPTRQRSLRSATVYENRHIQKG